MSHSADPSTAPGQLGGVLTIDVTGRILDLNPGAEALFGYPRDEAIGHRLGELIVPERLLGAHETGLRVHAAAGDGPLLDTMVRVPARHRDGHEFQIELMVSRARHGDQDIFVGIARAAGPTPPSAELLLHAGFFQALVEHSPTLIAVLDPDGHSRYTNPTAIALFCQHESLDAATFLEQAAHPADLAVAADALRAAAAGTLTEPAEFRLRARDGSWRPMSMVCRDLRDNPAVHGVALYAVDTSRAHAAEERERVGGTTLATLVESLRMGVLVQDQQRRVVLTNSAFVDLFELGDPPEALRGKTNAVGRTEYARLFADASAAQQRVDEVVRVGRPVAGDEIVLADGRTVERDYVPIRLDGSTLGHLWVFQDVSARATAQRLLEDRNRMLTELSALKTEFVAVLSHELRTPLTSIATFASMVDDDNPDPAETRAAIAAIRRNADRMLSLVADLVLLARLESGELHPARATVDLAGLLPGVAVPDGPSICGDEALLRQLFDTVTTVVAGISSAATVTATVEQDTWTVLIRANTTEPATTERLLATRLPHPDHPGEYRSGALALTLARAIAARHGGRLSTTLGPDTVTATIALPAGPSTPSGVAGSAAAAAH